MTAQDFAILHDQLTRDEGLRLKPYQDTRGNITIGYGRNLSDVGITQAEANAMLTQDIEIAWHALVFRFPVVTTLDAARQSVLANMCFNVGAEALAWFTMMWLAIEHGDFATAAREMLASDWARQVGARATRLAAAMASGELK